jgi:hypothetical protein
MKSLMTPLAISFCAVALAGTHACRAATSGRGAESARRTGRVRVVDNCLVDDDGPFLGLGVSYFTALWRCKYDRPRLESDLAFLSRQGFTSYRILSMVGHNASWRGLEIAPVGFETRDGRAIQAWPDYWAQLRDLVDIAFDKYGMRAQVTIFADAQLMPSRDARLAHMRGLVNEVVRGREHKILLLEVANEAWQNGFPGDDGVAELRALARDLNRRTDVPVAITSNHDGPGVDAGRFGAFDRLYRDSGADLATWHFSRDRREGDGWGPAYDCWDFAERPGCPPVVSNEPIGPGSSVNAEREPLRLVMAAAFAYAAKLPLYVFHCEAGVHGRARFEDTPGVGKFRELVRRLPTDLPSWRRSDGKARTDLFRVFAGGKPERYAPEVPSAADGCVRLALSHKGDRFAALPLGIRPRGLEIEARRPIEWTAYDPLSGAVISSGRVRPGQRATVPPGPGALVILGRVTPE